MALFSRIKTWVSNEILTASDLNAEFNNLLTNAVDSSIVGSSANASAMQSTTSPGGVGSESLAASVHDELLRIRYKLKEIIGGAQWYSTPDFDLTGTLGTSNIADGAITQAKRASLGQQLSSSSSTFTSNSGSFTDVTNLTVSITTTGRPVFLALVSDGSGNTSQIYQTNSTNASGIVTFIYLRGATEIARYEITSTTVASSGTTKPSIGPASNMLMIESVAAGTYTYKMQIKTDNTDTYGGVKYMKLMAFEL